MADTETQKLTETLYQHNLDLATVNKTLSLLRKLYQISLLSLDPQVLSQQISEDIRTDLKMEVVGIFSFNPKDDSLTPFNFSKSERLLASLHKLGFLFRDFKIDKVSTRPVLQTLFANKTFVTTKNLSDIWGGVIGEKELATIAEESNIQEVVLYPLITQQAVSGVLLLGINREYEALSEHEKESIGSCVDVIAVALDKAYLYKELQDANANLRDLIKQRESLVHLITHKVKGSFTRSKFLFAEMLAGSFGPLSPELAVMTQKGFESDVEGISTVDLVLNSANLQNGTVKYDMKPVDFKEIVSQLAEEKKKSAEARKLTMNVTIGEGEYQVLGDPFWLKEVVINLLENSIRYTQAGTITVTLEKHDKIILFSVKDTGVGITEEDKKNLFTEGGRGKDSVKVNVDSTGYGLFSVKLIVDAHKGRIWAESEGQGHGSQFYLELEGLN